MDTTTQGVIADTIGTQADVDARRRFWLTHMRIGFGIFLAETFVVALYLHLTPHGPHRHLLWIIAVIWILGAGAGLQLSPITACKSWRATYSLAWTVVASAVIGLVAILDNGVSSPLIYLLFLPIFFGTLMFSPRATALCGASALLAAGVVASADWSVASRQGRTFMLFASLAGAAALSVAAAVNRSAMEGHAERLLAEVADLAATDELTGCVVRRVLRQRMTEEIERAVRTHGPVSFLMLDVDQFKTINDSFGHVVGDRVLASIGSILLSNVRTFDVACRLGGDEFALLLPETDAQGAVQVAERIFRDLASAEDVPVTLSIGVSSLDPANRTVEHLFDEADMALYQVKRAGRDAIAVRGHDADSTTR